MERGNAMTPADKTPALMGQPHPFESEEYQRFVESMIPHCHCRERDRPCDGVLAGGLCDGITDDERESIFDDAEDFEP
jgi:hypothetical protein